MGRIVVTEFISLDGVIEDPGGAEGFRHGGWAFDLGEDGGKFKLDETLQSQALLLGRVTYEGFASAWPSMEGEFADKFNSMPKYVVSSTLQEPSMVAAQLRPANTANSSTPAMVANPAIQRTSSPTRSSMSPPFRVGRRSGAGWRSRWRRGGRRGW